MKGDREYTNPLQLMGIELPPHGLRIEDLYGKPVPESLSFEDGLPLMAAKILEMTRLLSRCLFSGSKAQMKASEGLAREIHQLEKVTTRSLLSREIPQDMIKGLVRLPFRLERIGHMLEHILHCCRTRACEGIPITANACTELEQLFSVLLDMMVHLRDGLVSPDLEPLERVLSRSKELGRLLRDYRSSHWARLAGGLCTPEGSSLYLDLLDSMKSINEYLEKIAVTFIDLGTASPTETDMGKKARKKRGRNGSH
jgi:Na+/phosphate symporter